VDTLYFDSETFSECDLTAHGTHRYAEHPSTEIMVAQWAVNECEPTVWDSTPYVAEIRRALASIQVRSRRSWEIDPLIRRLLPIELVELLEASQDDVAHNSAFDRTLLRHCWGIDVPVERWRDTMVKAYMHGLPGALGKIGPILGLPDDEQKDARGKKLIQLFCKPQPKNHNLRRATRKTHPAEWAEFLTYSHQDIVSMRAIDRALPSWNYRPGHKELALWHIDQRINDRGFQVDLDLAGAAIRATDIEKKRLKAETIEATNGQVSAPSKRDALLKFILAEYGVDLPDMKADTLRRRLEEPELPDGVKQLLAIRLEATKTSTAKYKAAIAATSTDGRLRNSLQFAGALRTRRWAGRILQPQNMPRPSYGFDEAMQEMAVTSLKGGYADIVFGDVMLATSDCIRGLIVAAPGKKLVVADLANIEGRMLAWLAGEEWKLQAFCDYDTYALDEFGQRIPVKDDFKRKGEDLYKLAYARSFNVDPSEAVGDKRQIGKVQELALGYEGGVAAYLTFAMVYKIDLDKMADAVHSTAPKDALARAYGVYEWALKKRRGGGLELPKNIYVACEVLKHAWREAHSATVQLWADASDAFKRAIVNEGVTFDIGQHLRCRRDGAWLRIRLPSGAYLCYLHPQCDDKGQLTYMGINPYTRQWNKVKTHGGKIIAECTQSSARDTLAEEMPAVDVEMPIVLTVHDELLTEVPDKPDFTVDRLVHLMSRPKAWAPGLPLAAAGFECYRYRKD
jgi:DNA polymerase bacteriophage-type